MRSYSQISPTFWTRGSGKKLRGNPVAQILAIYFMTAPQSNYTGLYYNSLTSICNDTGLSEEQVRETIPQLSEIIQYDYEAEVVWIPESASYQIGSTMHGNDKRKPLIMRELSALGAHPFVIQFSAKYAEAYSLPKEYQQLVLKLGKTPSTGSTSENSGALHESFQQVLLFDANPKKERSFLNGDHSEQNQQDMLDRKGHPGIADAPLLSNLMSSSLSSSDLGSDQDPTDQVDPEEKQLENIKRVFVFWQKTMKKTANKLDTKRKARIAARLTEGFTPENLRDAIIGATKDDFLMGRDKKSPRKYDGIETVLRDAAQVERLIELAGAKRDAKGGLIVQDREAALRNKEESDKKYEEAMRIRKESAQKLLNIKK